MFKRKVQIKGKKVVARLGLVHWKDAMIAIRQDGEFGELPDCMSIGFVANHDGITYVIHNFTDGVPADFMAIPSTWCVSTYYFKG